MTRFLCGLVAMVDLHDVLRGFVNEIHLYVIWAVGIVLALRRWRRSPQVSLVILIAFALELAQAAFRILRWYWFDLEMRAAGLSGSANVIHKFTILHYVNCGLEVLAWTLILVALFRWQYPPLKKRLRGYDGQYLPEDFASEGTTAEHVRK
jgi:hypothetical protein